MIYRGILDKGPASTNNSKRSKVQGFPLKAGFRVRDRDKIEDPKSS